MISKRSAVLLLAVALPLIARADNLVDLVLSHKIDRALPSGWSLVHVDVEQTQALVESIDASQTPRTLTLVPAGSSYEARLPPGLPQSEAAALQNVAAAIIDARPSSGTGPQPWSRKRTLAMGFLAVLAILGALGLVAFGGHDQ